MKEQEPTFVALAELTLLKLAYQKYDLTLMLNVGQLSLICTGNSFAINTVKLKQRTMKRKTKTEQNVIVLRIRFFETKHDQTFASYRKVYDYNMMKLLSRYKEITIILCSESTKIMKYFIRRKRCWYATYA